MASDRSSGDEHLDELEARIERLETAVAELRAFVRRDDKTTQPDTAQDRSEHEPGVSHAEDTTFSAIEGELEEHGAEANEYSLVPGWKRLRRTVEWILRLRNHDWLSYVGIGLLLFGLSFLFKYSVEQGWLVPQVRVAFGVFVGSALLVGGLRVYDQRLQLRQVFLGGSVAAFYGTTFAAYQLYDLLPYAAAFGSMVAITTVAIVLSLRQNHASMAVIGMLGGLGTPFLLYTDISGVAGLTVYTLLVLVGACAIYFYRGWQVVLYSAVCGGWLVLLFPSADAALSGVRPDDAWVLQTGIGTAWLLLGSAAVSRSVLNQVAWKGGRLSVLPTADTVVRDDALYSLVPVSPLAALVASRLLWIDIHGIWGTVAMVGALLYAGAYAGLRHVRLRRYAATHGIVAATLLAYLLASWFGGAALLFCWGLEAALLFILGRQLRDTPLRIAGHGLFAVVWGWLGTRLASTPTGVYPISAASLTELGVIAITLEATRRMDRWPRLTYGVLVLAGWLAWGRHVLLPLENGHAYVSAVWAATAAMLLVLGATRKLVVVQGLGLATMTFFVGKLFLVDLAALPALWRIVLFLGAGGGFLLVSYALPGIRALLDQD